MQALSPSELILNERGAIYHLNLKPEELASTVITVGDPARVREVSKHFDNIEFELQHREFITHTGTIGSKRISVISTGIGTPNIDIVLNELDAVANIDFSIRTIKEQLTSLNIIRIGTSGSVQEEIGMDSYVASTHAIGIDNLMNFYASENNEEEKQILQGFINHTGIQNNIGYPYISSASMRLIKHFVKGFHHGITVTCPGFYGPQGRMSRLINSHPRLLEAIQSFRFGNHQIANLEMETSALYGLSKTLHHNCVSLSAIVAHRTQNEFHQNSSSAVEKLIKNTLEIISTTDL